MPKHNHNCTCSHENVKFCSHCNTVYCLGCNQEWTAKSTWTSWPNYTYYPWYSSGQLSQTSIYNGLTKSVDYAGNPLPNTGEISNTLHDGHTTTCAHTHE